MNHYKDRLKKSLIIAFHPRTMTHYVTTYENTLKKLNKPYDVVFWDRFSNSELEKRDNEYILHHVCTLGGSKIKKIPAFFYFRKQLKYIISENSYDKIIVVNTMPGILLSDVLLTQYRGKYIFDIRDYTYEKYFFYKRRVKQLIKNSFFTAISSEGFKSFLGESKKLIINHNISNIEAGVDEPITEVNSKIDCYKQRYTIGFLGVIRYENENIKLINSFKDSDQFKFFYAGKMYPDCTLKEYCRISGLKNVEFAPEFSNEDKPWLYKDIDIINAIYGNKMLEVKTALPNKLYDAVVFKKPILVSSGTYLSDVVEKYGLGISVDVDKDNVKEKLLKYLDDYDHKQFCLNAERFLRVVMAEQNEYIKRIEAFVNEC